MPSSRIHHPEHGAGEIVTYRRGGRVAIVDFESKPMPTHVPVREFTVLDADGDGSAAPIGEGSGSTGADGPSIDSLLGAGPRFEGSRELNESSRVLEAMRLGVVADEGIDVYTVGRDVEVSQVQADLGRARREGGAIRAFLGDYGTGKTHLLQLVRQRALDENFLTARVVLDPRETPPSHPKRVYRELTKTLSYPDQPSREEPGLRPLFEKAVADEAVMEAFDVRPPGTSSGNRDERLEGGMHLYLTAALAYFRDLSAEDVEERVRTAALEESDDLQTWVRGSMELLFDWIEGRPTPSNRDIDQRLKKLRGSHPQLYSLMDYRPWARIYGYLLSGLSTLARAVGYSGLVVLVDEAERYSLLSRENRDFATYVFKAISCASVGRQNVPFAQSQLESLGGIGVLKDLPPRYDAHPGLYAVFAMTPHEEGVETLYEAVPRAKVDELERFDDRDYAELAAKVCDFYASAHPDWEMTEKVVTRSTSLLEDCRHRGWVENPRQAMKFLVEFLDVARHHPDEVGTVVRDIEQFAAF